jgi:hypothetical protein
MKTTEQTTATEVPGYKVIAQDDLLSAINAELAKIGEKPCELWGLVGPSLSIDFESPIRYAQCSVSIGMPRADMTCADYADYRLHSVEVEISWSSTGRTVAQAAVALENYRRALGIAAFIEALTAGRYIAVAK